MKQEIIKDLSTSELREKITEEVNSFNKLKINHSISPVENPMKIGQFRKMIARMKTELNKRDKQSIK